MKKQIKYMTTNSNHDRNAHTRKWDILGELIKGPIWFRLTLIILILVSIIALALIIRSWTITSIAAGSSVAGVWLMRSLKRPPS